MKNYLFVIFSFVFWPLYGQVNSDSLKARWNERELPDSTRIAALNKLAWNFIFTYPDSALHYAQIHYDFARARGLQKEMAVARNTQGTSCYMSGNYDKAIAYFFQSLKIKENIDDYKGIAATLNNIGMIYDEQRDHKKAARYYLQAIDNFNKIPAQQENDLQILVASYHNLGALYLNTEDYDSALVYFKRTLELTKNSRFARERAYTFSNLGNLYLEKGEVKKSHTYFTQAYGILEEIGDEVGMIDALNNLSFFHMQQSAYQKAIPYASQALERAQRNRATGQARDAAERLYESYKQLGNSQKALAMHELYMSLKDSLKIEQNKEEVLRQEFTYTLEKQAIADSIAYAAQQEIQNVKIAEQQLQLKSEKTQRQLLYGILALIVVLSIVSFRSYQRKVKAGKIIMQQKLEVEEQRDKIAEQHRQLEEKNQKIIEFNNSLEILVRQRTQELEDSLKHIRNYQFNLAHNIRAPFVTLLGLLNLIQDDRIDSKDNKLILEKLQETSNRIELVLQDISEELNQFDAEIEQAPRLEKVTKSST